MREKLQDRNPPWWVLSLITGLLFGAIMTVSNHAQQSSSWTSAMVGGLVGGVIFGGFMGPLFARQRRKVSALVGDLPRRDLRIASRAVMRGPVPVDPDIRQAAVLLATQQLKGAPRLRRFGLVAFSVLGVFSAILALTSSPWWWTTVVIYAALVAAYLWLPGHLKRRLEILNQKT